ncbi:MAG: dihydrofolate reductase family protein [Polyangiaceae bacterium]
MRSIVMFNRVSAEGHFASHDGAMDWTVPEPAIDKAALQGMPHTDTVLFGRRTYEMFASFWPHVLDQGGAAPDPHDDKRRTPELGAMARWLNEAEKLVFSRTLRDPSWHRSRVLGAFDPREIAALKRGPGKSIIVFGSGSIVSLLAEHELIDEYRFVVSPVFLGGGKPLLRGLTKRLSLRLLDATPYESGNVMLRYAPAAGKA